MSPFFSKNPKNKTKKVTLSYMHCFSKHKTYKTVLAIWVQLRARPTWSINVSPLEAFIGTILTYEWFVLLKNNFKKISCHKSWIRIVSSLHELKNWTLWKKSSGHKLHTGKVFFLLNKENMTY